jgi:hypothetical protein
LLDSFQFERRGIPATGLITDQFIPGAKAITSLNGYPDYPFVVVPHPLESLTPEELDQRAELAMPQLVKILTKPRS